MSDQPIDPVPYEPEGYVTPEPPARPSTVTAAGWSQYAIAALAVVSTVLSVVVTLDYMDRLESALSDVPSVTPQDLELIIQFSTVLAIGVSVVSLLFAAVVGLMGLFVMRGKNWARVTTWVLAGIGLACGICSGLAMPFNQTTQVTGGDEFTRALNEVVNQVTVPGWFTALSIVTTVLSTILYLVVIVLLALPASNPFFRRQPPQPVGLPPV
ncbi:hypothetical protein LX16_2340 [Stackebrandtia albiflava]|uniref:Uncharacterized protein n=1 Tax=Stackebrandtia albiflava TaxID=406432 RepID=A0A562V163_9ACTN|nr:hypothetical protein [Stackebrandtia albiflava]TWJ11614.1 hypothetical protein LX16_2340 [Stackebrandtia albiflava]